MPTEILMPALSPTMEEGTLAKWHVKEGDTVSSGDIMAEIETDKATMEFGAVDEGVMGKIMIAEGTEGVKVNDVIAILLEEGETADDISTAPAPKAAVVAPAATAEAAVPSVEYGKKNPFPSEVLEQVLLSGKGSGKETWHFELNLEGSGLTYEAGDTLAALPHTTK